MALVLLRFDSFDLFVLLQKHRQECGFKGQQVSGHADGGDVIASAGEQIANDVPLPKACDFRKGAENRALEVVNKLGNSWGCASHQKSLGLSSLAAGALTSTMSAAAMREARNFSLGVPIP